MKVNVKVASNISVPKYLKKVNDKNFWKFTAVQFWRHMFPYIDMDTGMLATTTDVTVAKKDMKLSDSTIANIALNSGNIQGFEGSAEIVFEAPYASVRHSYEGPRKNRHSPKATGNFDEVALKNHKDDLLAEMQGYIDSGRLKLNE